MGLSVTWLVKKAVQINVDRADKRGGPGYVTVQHY